MESEFRNFVTRVAQTARDAAERGAAVARDYFQRDIAFEIKDDSSPVTMADRNAERALISLIDERFKDHSILAEESGHRQRDPDNRWIIDPIDGTRGFIRGGKFWGTLVGFEHRGEIIAGAICLPILNLSYWAGKGIGCYRNEDRIFLSKVEHLQEATLSIGEMQHIFHHEKKAVWLELLQCVGSTRCYGDPGGLMMLLEGQADIWIEAGVKPWDIAPAKILVEEAGGIFSNFRGEGSLEEGEALASTRPLHQQILDRLLSSHCN